MLKYAYNLDTEHLVIQMIACMTNDSLSLDISGISCYVLAGLYIQ